MKISKRMLAVLCTLLMLVSCFALPYGAMAAEETATGLTIDLYKSSSYGRDLSSSESDHYLSCGRNFAFGEGTAETPVAIADYGKKTYSMSLDFQIETTADLPDFVKVLKTTAEAQGWTSKAELPTQFDSSEWLQYIHNGEIKVKSPSADIYKTGLSGQGVVPADESGTKYVKSITIPLSYSLINAAGGTVSRLEHYVYNDFHTFLADKAGEYYQDADGNALFTNDSGRDEIRKEYFDAYQNSGVKTTVTNVYMYIGTEDIVTSFSWNDNRHIQKNSSGTFGFDWSNAADGTTGDYNNRAEDATTDGTGSATGIDCSGDTNGRNPNYVLKADLTFTETKGLTADAAWEQIGQLSYRFRSPKKFEEGDTEPSNGEPNWSYIHMPWHNYYNTNDASYMTFDGYTLQIEVPLPDMNSGDNIDWANVFQINIQAERLSDATPTELEMTLSNVRVVDLTSNLLRAELKEAVSALDDYVYDDTTGEYEAALTAAEAVLDNAYASTANLQAAIDALNTAKTAMKVSDPTYEVATFSQQNTKNNANVGTKQYYYNWTPADNLPSDGIDLTDDIFSSNPSSDDYETKYSDKIGANRYFVATVTLKWNEAYEGDMFGNKYTPENLTGLLNNVQLRTQSSSIKDRPAEHPKANTDEHRSDTFEFSESKGTVTLVSTTDTEIVYQVKGLMSDETENTGDRMDMNWHDLRKSLIIVNVNSILRGNPDQTNSENAEYINVPSDFAWTSGSDGTKDQYKNAQVAVICELSDVKIVNETQNVAKQELETLVNAEAPNDMVYTEASLKVLEDAKTAGKAVLDDTDVTYREISDAIAAIHAAQANLTVIGHVVKDFSDWNGSVNYSTSNNFYKDWLYGNQVIDADLSKYDKNQLHVRMNVNFAPVEGAPIEGITISTTRLGVRSYVGTEQMIIYRPEFNWGDNVVDIAWNDFSVEAAQDPIHMDAVNNITLIVELKKDGDTVKDAADKYTMTIDNACIVDTTAEMNLGSKVNDEGKVESTVKTVGNGRIEITGDYLYGGDDILTAKEGANSTFVGWKKNDTFVAANDVEDALTLPVNGKQNITAYFAAADETVVVYTGKYNRVIDVKVVKAASKLVAPAAPAITGQTLNGWDVEGDELTAAVEGAKGGYTTVQAVYKTNTEAAGYNVTVENATAVFANVTPGQNENGAYVNVPFDTRVSLTAQAPADGQVFSHWIVNDKIAGYADTLTAYVSGTMTIKAVFVENEAAVAAPELQAGITQAEMVANGETYNFEIIAQTYLPDDYELMAYGVIFAPTEGDLTAADGKTLDVVSSSSIRNRQYKITLENVKAGKTRWAMAYITARDAEGNVTIVYSDAVFAETPAAE